MSSRQSMVPNSSAQQRTLTLTEELEKLDQSITLTLQEIDSNFSRAHRTVTSSILPVVQRYAAHSSDVWEGSRFWKQFFEASANISLTGYEEKDAEDDNTFMSGATDGEVGESISTNDGERPTSRLQDEGEEPSLLDSPSVTVQQQQQQQQQQGPHQDAATPKAGGRGKHPASQPHRHHRKDTTSSFAEYPSPYESLKQDVNMSSIQTAPPPRTPATATRTAITPSQTRPSPFNKSSIPLSTTRHDATRNPSDPLLHRVLDRNYRVQATPHTARRKPPQPQHPNQTQPPQQTEDRTSLLANLSSSPFSPDVPAPQLRPDIFGTPARTSKKPTAAAHIAPSGPRTPGVSVQRPRPRARSHTAPSTSARKTLFPPGARDAATTTTDDHVFDYRDDRLHRQRCPYDEDDDMSDTSGLFDGAVSPPKTMQFSVPQSRLLQTPAAEASRRIVEDLLSSAQPGGDADPGYHPAGERYEDVFGGEDDASASLERPVETMRSGPGEGAVDEYSPSVVKGARAGLGARDVDDEF